MTAASWVQLVVLAALLVGTAPLLGRYLTAVYLPAEGKAPGDRFFGPIERLVYRAARIDPDREQRWTTYAYSILAFSVVGMLVLYALQRLQEHLPGNPVGLGGVVPHLSFNTAVSFVTNTNWQSYGGETTLSHLVQMMGMTTQNVVSAAAGLAVMAALIRGLARQRSRTVGSFWVDLVRGTVRFLLPASLLLAVALAGLGVVQNLSGFTEVTTVEGATQVLPGGPAASQVAIKQLGTNGGGFFNVNSAHPFENPTGLTNLLELYAILIVPFALAVMFGRAVGDRRQGRAVVAIMATILLAFSALAVTAEVGGNPLLKDLGVDQVSSSEQAGGNLEGKELRFGPSGSAVWAGATTGTSNGSVNSMHDSYTPAGGGVALGQIMLGEISPGGVGVGLNGLLVFAMLSVFIAGLMVGRTPEYLGKKIQAAEMKVVVLYLLAMPVALLGFAAASLMLDSALASIQAPASPPTPSTPVRWPAGSGATRTRWAPRRS
jgi:K+-transporting ATPase ATPase A chain